MKKTALALVLMSASFGLVTAGTATALTAKSFKYAAPKTGYLQLPATAMVPADNFSAVDYGVSWPSNKLTGNGCYQTGVSLPQGAKIVALTLDHQGQIYANMFETPMGGGTAVNMVDESTPTVVNQTLTTITLPQPKKINNAANFYSLGICIEPGEEYYGARVRYTYTNAGD